MKYTYLTLIVLLMIFSSCKKEEEDPEHQEPEIPNQTTPEKVQWGFALYYTATW